MKQEYINFYKQIANYNPTKILHIGGHIGQEGEIYKDICPFTFVEPIPKFAEIIFNKGYEVIKTAIGKEKGVRDFYIKDQISSFLMTKVPHKQKKTTVNVVKLSDIQKGYDVLVVDVEGATMEVLQSGKLDFKVIIVELREEPAFIGEETKETITGYLYTHGYKLVNSFERDYLFVKNY